MSVSRELIDAVLVGRQIVAVNRDLMPKDACFIDMLASPTFRVVFSNAMRE